MVKVLRAARSVVQFFAVVYNVAPRKPCTTCSLKKRLFKIDLVKQLCGEYFVIS